MVSIKRVRKFVGKLIMILLNFKDYTGKWVHWHEPHGFQEKEYDDLDLFIHDAADHIVAQKQTIRKLVSDSDSDSDAYFELVNIFKELFEIFACIEDNPDEFECAVIDFCKETFSKKPRKPKTIRVENAM